LTTEKGKWGKSKPLKNGWEVEAGLAKGQQKNTFKQTSSNHMPEKGNVNFNF
jgi:hypothetical protein